LHSKQDSGIRRVLHPLPVSARVNLGLGEKSLCLLCVLYALQVVRRRRVGSRCPWAVRVCVAWLVNPRYARVLVPPNLYTHTHIPPPQECCLRWMRVSLCRSPPPRGTPRPTPTRSIARVHHTPEVRGWWVMLARGLTCVTQHWRHNAITLA